MRRSLEKGSGWITDKTINHTISIPVYYCLAEYIYIKLLKELDHSIIGLIVI